jgi:hypothetical protein
MAVQDNVKKNPRHQAIIGHQNQHRIPYPTRFNNQGFITYFFVRSESVSQNDKLKTIVEWRYSDGQNLVITNGTFLQILDLVFFKHILSINREVFVQNLSFLSEPKFGTNCLP